MSMVTVLKKKKPKSSPPNNAISIKSVSGRAISKKLNPPKKTIKNKFILNASFIQDRLDGALAKAIELYKISANGLGVRADVRGCRLGLGDSKNQKILKKAYESPEKRQLLGVYISAREALHSLYIRIEKAKILGGDMSREDVLHLLDSFHWLGVASYGTFDRHIQDDFAEIEERGRKKGVEEGFNAQKIAAEFLPQVNIHVAPIYTDIASRNAWIRGMSASVSGNEIIHLWNRANPKFSINANTIKNAVRDSKKPKKELLSQSIQDKSMNQMVRSGKKSGK